ncbi:DUF3854 domain-containing protein [Nostoc sp. XA010]|uniref:DUF3854 domain-containing protein n=1 Tax=Nostoc sp. XA010 TaxID=2780407 RepID=UPI001E41ACCC|nr:DUF3854 domain-containing protein [Nostoc sp. XA010]MCC5660832.1 DUF3854 domain-containing protein [Nostoc sp. XA010]
MLAIEDFIASTSSHKKLNRRHGCNAAPFATQGRQVNICFDQDNKPETVQRVRTAISRMGRLLVNEGCSLWVIDLPEGLEKAGLQSSPF